METGCSSPATIHHMIQPLHAQLSVPEGTDNVCPQENPHMDVQDNFVLKSCGGWRPEACELERG